MQPSDQYAQRAASSPDKFSSALQSEEIQTATPLVSGCWIDVRALDSLAVASNI